MSFAFSVTQYLGYRWRAKGLHGTHSPFVYDFIEQVVQYRGNIKILPEPLFAGAGTRSAAIISRALQYYSLKKGANLAHQSTMPAAPLDWITLCPEHPEKWCAHLEQWLPECTNESIVFVPDLHVDAAHFLYWNQLKQQHSVRMSLDLFAFGILLFRKEFKETQHFVLRRR